MNVNALRNHLRMGKHNVEISREDFENNFFKTAERVTFTFNGWDGKSYDGESRSGYVYRTAIEGYEDVRFVKVGKGLHYIDENSDVIEKATGIAHKEAEWLVDVSRVRKLKEPNRTSQHDGSTQTVKGSIQTVLDYIAENGTKFGRFGEDFWNEYLTHIVTNGASPITRF